MPLAKVRRQAYSAVSRDARRTSGPHPGPGRLGDVLRTLARRVGGRVIRQPQAAERFGVSQTTAKRWADRYRQLGEAGMGGRSSRPHRSPRRTPTRTERRILGLRVSLRWGPARIAHRLRLAISTVHRVLSRHGAPPLRWIDPATGVRVRSSRPAPRRYEHEAPGDLVHAVRAGRGGQLDEVPAEHVRGEPAVEVAWRT